MDRISVKRRSANMQRIRRAGTKPELIVRRIVRELNHRYRLHRKDLPGRPDLVFSKLRRVIFVHGCFWHQHKGCKRATLPQSNTDFWLTKLARNKARDTRQAAMLKADKWKVLVVWECETKIPIKLTKRIERFLN